MHRRNSRPSSDPAGAGPRPCSACRQSSWPPLRSSPSRPERECDVLRLVAEGGTNADVAAALFLSEASIKAILQGIYEKLGVRHRAAAVGEVYRRGLLA